MSNGFWLLLKKRQLTRRTCHRREVLAKPSTSFFQTGTPELDPDPAPHPQADRLSAGWNESGNVEGPLQLSRRTFADRDLHRLSYALRPYSNRSSRPTSFSTSAVSFIEFPTFLSTFHIFIISDGKGFSRSVGSGSLPSQPS